MKIAINALAAKSGGGITYLVNLLPQVSKYAKDSYFYVFLPVDQNELDLGKEFSNMKIIRLNFFNNILLRFVYDQLILPIILLYLKIDILYCPTDIATILAPCKTVLAIRNPNPYSGPRQNSKRRLKFFIQKILTRFSTWKACVVIFVSEYHKNLVSRQLRIRTDKTKVIYHGINHSRFENSTTKKQDKRFQRNIDTSNCFLTVSDIYEHKDMLTLVRAYRTLSETIINSHALVIAGSKKTDSVAYSKLVREIRDLALEDRILFTGRVPYKNIAHLYRDAMLFILPSRLETFGHPLLEAMASGVPIIASNATAIPEILGGAGVLFNTGAPRDLAGKIQQVLNDENLRVALRTRGYDRVKSFSWEKAATELLEVFRNSASL